MLSVICVLRKSDNSLETYKSLKAFCKDNPEYKYDRLTYWLSRLRMPFEDNRVKIEKTKIRK